MERLSFKPTSDLQLKFQDNNFEANFLEVVIQANNPWEFISETPDEGLVDADVVSISVKNVIQGRVLDLPISNIETPANITMNLYEKIRDNDNSS